MPHRLHAPSCVVEANFGVFSDMIIISFGEIKINVHRPAIKKSAMLEACFRNKMLEGLSGQMSPSEGDLESWLVLLFAMYNGQHLPLGAFQEYSGVLLVNALGLADYCLVSDDIKQKLATLVVNHFVRLHHWKEVRYNDFTKVLHEHTLQDINATYLAYRDSNAGFKPFPLESFGVMIALLCPAYTYTKYEDDLDEGLARLVACNAMKVSNHIAIEVGLCNLFISPA